MDALAREMINRPAESINELLDSEYQSAAGLVPKAQIEDEPIESLVKLIDGRSA